MGLFDGYDKMQRSSAQIAETLEIPVILGTRYSTRETQKKNGKIFYIKEKSNKCNI